MSRVYSGKFGCVSTSGRRATPLDYERRKIYSILSAWLLIYVGVVYMACTHFSENIVFQ
jgi:hypothetical protein